MTVKEIQDYMKSEDVCKVSANTTKKSMQFQDRVRAGFNEDKYTILYDDYCDMYIVCNDVFDFGDGEDLT